MLCVLLCYRLLSAHWVFLVVAGCLVLCVCAPVLASLVRARGLAFRLGGCLLGFPAVVCAVTPFPTISSLCNKHQGTEQHTQHHTALSATKAKERDHSLTPGIQATRAQRLQPQQRRRGFARRLCCGCRRCALVACIPGVREWSRSFALVALRAV